MVIKLLKLGMVCQSLREMILNVATLAVPIVLLSYLQGSVGDALNLRRFAVRMSYTDDIRDKVMDCDYEHLEDSNFHTTWSKAVRATMNSHSGTEAIIVGISDFTINILGLILYSYVLLSLNILVVLILLLFSIINLYI